MVGLMAAFSVAVYFTTLLLIKFKNANSHNTYRCVNFRDISFIKP